MKNALLVILLPLVICVGCYGSPQQAIIAESYIETTFAVGESYVEWTLTEEFGYYEILALEGG